MLSTPFLPVPPKDYGGTELVVYELCEGLFDRGHEVTVFATGDSKVRGNLRYLFRDAQWPPDPVIDMTHISWAMAEIVADGGFDVVHVNSAMALAVCRCYPSLPVVYTLHHALEERLSTFYRQFSTPFYVAISENQRRLEVPLERCRVIHHGLSSEVYEWTEKAADYVCFVGRFSPVKGLHTAIDVAEKAGVTICVAGEAHPADAEYAEREIEPRLKREHVRALGCLGPSGKVPLLRNARALLAPIEWEEPFGLILIEAMLSGCPVVAFPRGSVPELVEQGVTGFVVHSAEEMAEVIRPGGVLDAFDRRRCRERAVERFSRERLVADYEKLYRDAIWNLRGTQNSQTGILPV